MHSMAARKAGKHGLSLILSKHGQSQSIAFFSSGATVSSGVTQYTTLAAAIPESDTMVIGVTCHNAGLCVNAQGRASTFFLRLYPARAHFLIGSA